jgi:hypothetical protein
VNFENAEVRLDPMSCLRERPTYGLPTAECFVHVGHDHAPVHVTKPSTEASIGRRV